MRIRIRNRAVRQRDDRVAAAKQAGSYLTARVRPGTGNGNRALAQDDHLCATKKSVPDHGSTRPEPTQRLRNRVVVDAEVPRDGRDGDATILHPGRLGRDGLVDRRRRVISQLDVDQQGRQSKRRAAAPTRPTSRTRTPRSSAPDARSSRSTRSFRTWTRDALIEPTGATRADSRKRAFSRSTDTSEAGRNRGTRVTAPGTKRNEVAADRQA